MHTDTDYLDGFQYKNNVLEFFGHAEGFVANNSNILKYVFQYKDQVGNVRVSYAANTITGQAEILEENHYYPYGLKHAGYGLNTTDQNAAYKYRYNSREWQNELDINFTSMDFRLYDNALGRFFGIDALSEQNHYLSTYQFGDGNPVKYADPSGLSSSVYNWEGPNEGQYTIDGKVVTFAEAMASHGLNTDGTPMHAAIDAGNSAGGSGGASGGTAGTSVNVIVAIFSPAEIQAFMSRISIFKGWTLIFSINVQDAYEKLNAKFNDGEIDNLVLWGHGNSSSLYIGSYFSNYDNVVERSSMSLTDFDAFSRGESHREYLTDLQYGDMVAFRNIAKKVKEGGNFIIGNCHVGSNEFTMNHIISAGKLDKVNTYFNEGLGGYNWTDKPWSIRSDKIKDNTKVVIHRHLGITRTYSDLIINNSQTNPIIFVQ